MIRSPLLWSGSKFDLLPAILPHIKGRLWEPFCGSAVVSLNYQGESAVSDRCAPLMNFWAQAKAGSVDYSGMLWGLDADSYYAVRGEFNSRSGHAPQWDALRFLYLNRTCWRGLWRENNNGEFNVPWGTRKRVDWPKMPDMSRVEVYGAEPYDTRRLGWRGCDTIYCDPPYVGTHSYGVKFDHERFAKWCASRTERVLVSNSPEALPLFQGWLILELTSKGGIGHRRKEVLLWNGK